MKWIFHDNTAGISQDKKREGKLFPEVVPVPDIRPIGGLCGLGEQNRDPSCGDQLDVKFETTNKWLANATVGWPMSTGLRGLKGENPRCPG